MKDQIWIKSKVNFTFKCKYTYRLYSSWMTSLCNWIWHLTLFNGKLRDLKNLRAECNPFRPYKLSRLIGKRDCTGLDVEEQVEWGKSGADPYLTTIKYKCVVPRQIYPWPRPTTRNIELNIALISALTM